MTGKKIFTAIVSDLVGVYCTDGTAIFADSLHRRGVSLEALQRFKDERRIATTSGESIENILESWQREVGTIFGTHDLMELLLSSYLPNDPVVDLYQRLGSVSNLRFALLTNNLPDVLESINERFKPRLGPRGLQEQFSVVVASYELGARKPQEEMYKEALAKLGVAAETTVCIDDKSDNLVAAQRLGMTPVLYLTPQKLELDLKGLHMEFPAGARLN